MTILITIVTKFYAILKVMINFEGTRFQETEDYRTDMAEVFKQSETNFNIALTIDGWKIRRNRRKFPTIL